MEGTSPKLDTRPLYVQVRAALLARIQNGVWKPGALLPNEFDLAREMGVSQGTVRKALGRLTADHLLVRRQGRGTFVVEQTPQHELFRFFNLHDDNGGEQILPDSLNAALSTGKAQRLEQARLGLEKDAKVVRIRRLRTRAGAPFIVERIALPEALFKGLASLKDVPNTLYDLYQRSFGITVARTDERLSAIAAKHREASALGVANGDPLLRIDRVTFSIDDLAVEWRVSHCHLQDAHYLALSGQSARAR